MPTRRQTQKAATRAKVLTDARLAWLYGPLHRSERRAATRADINAWNRLGSVRRTAA